jgi:hypothetical protein
LKLGVFERVVTFIFMYILKIYFILKKYYINIFLFLVFFDDFKMLIYIYIYQQEC